MHVRLKVNIFARRRSQTRSWRWSKRNVHVFREPSVCEAVGEERCCGGKMRHPSFSVIDPPCRWSPSDGALGGKVGGLRGDVWLVNCASDLIYNLVFLPHSVRWICDIKCIYFCATVSPYDDVLIWYKSEISPQKRIDRKPFIQAVNAFMMGLKQEEVWVPESSHLPFNQFLKGGRNPNFWLCLFSHERLILKKSKGLKKDPEWASNSLNSQTYTQKECVQCCHWLLRALYSNKQYTIDLS